MKRAYKSTAKLPIQALFTTIFTLSLLLLAVSSALSDKYIKNVNGEKYTIISPEDLNKIDPGAGFNYRFFGKTNNSEKYIQDKFIKTGRYAVPMRFLSCKLFKGSFENRFLYFTEKGALLDKYYKPLSGYKYTVGDDLLGNSDTVSNVYRSPAFDVNSVGNAFSKCDSYYQKNGGAPIFILFLDITVSNDEYSKYNIFLDDVSFSGQTISLVSYASKLWLSDFTSGLSDLIITGEDGVSVVVKKNHKK